MKRCKVWNRFRWIALLVSGCWLFDGGCVGFVQRELEVLMAPGSNPTLVRNSFLYDVFGPELLVFMSKIR